MAKVQSEVSADKLALFDKLVATFPEVQLKGATVPYTSLNGHMFSYLSKTGTLALRLPEGVRESFLKKYKARLCEQYGVVQKEYVEVPDALLRNTSALSKYFALSLAHVGALKPKSASKNESGDTHATSNAQAMPRGQR
ncbi:hypothetical protein [Rhodanobacter sp. MP7CTX1]|uniref:hypothetical protein n=1 Tax=Rhodanobacter sp. MP7CTX1 TaxID=2723084 RepID=UPI00160AA89E|nr:hypothetical protein [Rhodanobacter sp. MP7CTX1]MBB6187979.1 hypothetical protein [Rhodanobacter sp. MP7CTX1]